MKKFNSLRLDLAEKHLTPAEKKKREEIAMAMERENPGMPMGKKMAIATSAAKRVAEENLDELKSSTLTSYIDKVATGPSRGNKNIKAIGGVTTAIRKRAENENPPFEPNVPTGERKDQFGNPIKNVAKHLAKQGMKSVTEEIKTTHEDPLVVVKDAEGNILTHANRSVAGDIHGINVSHHTIHTGMPVEVVDRDGKKLTVQKSMHHDSEVAKDNAPDVKEEADKKYTHIVKHIKTGNVVGKYTSLKAAHRAADKKDMAYGAVAHQVDYIREAKEKTEYDYEGDMARGQLQSIIMNAQRVHDMLKDNDNLPEWVQSKITLAEDYISTVSNYMSSEIDEMHLSFGSQDKKPAPVSAKLADMKKYFATNDKDQMKQKITGKKFHDMSEYEAWKKSKNAMQVASFQPDGENKLDEISSNTLHSYMKAAHTKYSNIEYKNDPASVTKKEKIDKGIKKAYKKMYPPKKSEPENKVDMSSAGAYYASKKPGQYTGD